MYIKKTNSRTLTKDEWLYIAENYETSGARELSEKFKCNPSAIYHVVHCLRKGGVKVGEDSARKVDAKVEFVKQNIKQ